MLVRIGTRLRASRPEGTRGVTGTCHWRSGLSRPKSAFPVPGPGHPLPTTRSRPASKWRDPRGRTPGPPSGEKRKELSPQPRPEPGGGPHRRGLGPGLVRPYRSGSGSPPQCCGLRTRTKAPPFSRWGTRRVSLSPRATSVCVPKPGGGHSSGDGGYGVERAQARPRGLLGTPLPRPGRGAGRERKKGWEGERKVLKSRK